MVSRGRQRLVFWLWDQLSIRSYQVPDFNIESSSSITSIIRAGLRCLSLHLCLVQEMNVLPPSLHVLRAYLSRWELGMHSLPLFITHLPPSRLVISNMLIFINFKMILNVRNGLSVSSRLLVCLGKWGLVLWWRSLRHQIGPEIERNGVAVAAYLVRALGKVRVCFIGWSWSLSFFAALLLYAVHHQLISIILLCYLVSIESSILLRMQWISLALRPSLMLEGIQMLRIR